MGIVSLLCAVVVLATVAPAQATPDRVTSLSIPGGPIIGGSTQTATGTVTVSPGSDNTSGWVSVSFLNIPIMECLPPSMQIGYAICSTPSSTFTVRFRSSYVFQTTTFNVQAYAQDYPGQTATLTVNQPHSSISFNPASITGNGLDPTTATVTLDAPSYDGVTITLRQNPGTLGVNGGQFSVVIAAGSATGTRSGIIGTYNPSIPVSTVYPDYGIWSSATVTVNKWGSNADTQCAKGSGEGGAGAPINCTTGNVWIEHQDVAIPGLGGGLVVRRTWNSLHYEAIASQSERVGLFGDGWRSLFEEKLVAIDANTKRYFRGNAGSWMFIYDTPTATWRLDSPTNERATLSYNGSQWTLKFADGSDRIFSYYGYLVSFADRNGNRTAINGNSSNGWISGVTDAAGRALSFNHNAPGNSTVVGSISDAGGTLATYTYDASSRLTRVTYADGSIINYIYDANSLMTSVTDNDGKVLEAHTYDDRRRGLTSERANGADRLIVSYISDTLTRLTDSRGYVTDYTHFTIGTTHKRRFISSVAGPGCATCSGRGNLGMQYNPNGYRTQYTDELGRATTYTYDALGNVASRAQVVNGQTLTWSYTYNGFGQVLTATDPMGYVTTNTYDAKGNLLTTTTPSPDGIAPGNTTTFTYDLKGQLTSIKDPRNNTATLAYTAAGLIETITNPQSKVTKYEYDARGNRTAATADLGGLGIRTTFEYDLRNRLKKINHPTTPATSTQFSYDLRGRRTSVTDANGKVTTYGYDDADRLTSVTDTQTPSPAVTSYAYDTENNLSSITDALGRVTGFAYDERGRLTRTDFPSLLSESYTYDAAGNLLSKLDRKGQTINYAYDALNRITQKDLPDAADVDYTYDNNSRLTQVTDATGTYSFTYDRIGRLTAATTSYSFLAGQSYTVNYGYDAASNRTSMTDPQSSTTNYVYDTLNRLQTLQSPQGNFGFSYDALSRRTQMTRPNGVNTNYTYDSLSRLLTILHQVGANTIDGATYTYDNAGNRLTKLNHLNAVTDTYGYDNIYQLLSVLQGATTTESYTYDKVGNRLSSLGGTTYTVNNANQLTSVSGSPNTTFTYDNNGNTATKVGGTGTTTYTWNSQNQLKQVSLPGEATVTFKYDPFGRRAQKVSASGIVNYLYDGANVIEELDSAGLVLAKYAQGPGIDQPLAMIRGGTTSYYDGDGLGSITSLTDNTGTIANSYTYESFGKLTTSSGTVVNPFRYTGREFDSETGMHYYRARYYGSSAGRFINEDPTRFEEGNNFYSYVFNNAINLADPAGEQAVPKVDPVPKPGPIPVPSPDRPKPKPPSFCVANPLICIGILYLLSPGTGGDWANSQEAQFERDQEKKCKTKDCKKILNDCLDECHDELLNGGEWAFRRCMKDCMDRAGCSYTVPRPFYDSHR